MRYGFFEPVGLEVELVGEVVFAVRLVCLAGAKVLPKLDPGPVSADGSGSVIGSKRAAAAFGGGECVRLAIMDVSDRCSFLWDISYLFGAYCSHCV